VCRNCITSSAADRITRINTFAIDRSVASLARHCADPFDNELPRYEDVERAGRRSESPFARTGCTLRTDTFMRNTCGVSDGSADIRRCTRTFRSMRRNAEFSCSQQLSLALFMTSSFLKSCYTRARDGRASSGREGKGRRKYRPARRAEVIFFQRARTRPRDLVRAPNEITSAA